MVGRQNADIADTLHLRDVAMTTTFSLSMGYNFSCMIASDTLLHSRGGFSGSSYPTRMWANAQPDGRPAEHRWRPLFNAAKFG